MASSEGIEDTSPGINRGNAVRLYDVVAQVYSSRFPRPSNACPDSRADFRADCHDIAQLFDCDRIDQLLDCDLVGLQTGEDTVEDSRAKAPQPRLWCGVRAGTNPGDTATIL